MPCEPKSTVSFLTRSLAVALVGVLLGACAETQFLMHTAKRMNKGKTSTTYKVGNPYQINGIWYRPAEDWNYSESGIASWYGPQFDGRKTANGEVFDQWAVSAAHRTLPMPSIVRVTNLDNGRSLVVRINDRGPFARSRIIDMSRRGAQMLGFEKNGTARVQIRILAKESRALAERLKAGKVEVAADMPALNGEGLRQQPVARQSLPPQPKPAPQPIQTASIEPVSLPRPEAQASIPEPVKPDPVTKVGEISQVPVSPTGIYIQAGAFSDISNAERVKTALDSIGNVIISPVQVGARELYRVRLGPVAEVGQADQLLQQVAANGYPEARTVVEKAATR